MTSFDDGDFVVGENALTECVLAVALFKGAAMFDCHADKQSHRVRAKDRGIFLRLGPDAIFVVAKDDDAGLRPERVKHLILFDGKNAHGRNGFWDSFSAKGVVRREADLDVRILGFDATFLFAEACQPRVAIGMAGMKTGEEGAGAFALNRLTAIRFWREPKNSRKTQESPPW